MKKLLIFILLLIGGQSIHADSIIHYTETVPDTLIKKRYGKSQVKGKKIMKIDGCIHDGFLTFQNLDAEIDITFLYYFFLAHRQTITDNVARGLAQKNLNTELVGNIIFAYPSLKIQKKIVLKLDQILQQLEEKKKQILHYKEKKEETMSQLSQKTIGGIIINHMKLDNPSKDWQIKALEDCADIQAGFAQGQKNIPDGTIHLRMNNISRNFQINYNLMRTINPTKNQLMKYKLEKGDVVFNNTNSPELVGKSFIFNDEKICLYSNHLTRCRVKKDLILPEWLLFYIRGKWLRRDFERMCNKWINQAAVGGAKLKKLEIPIPPLSEQKQILKILTNTSIQFEGIANLTKSITIKDLENKKLIEHIQSSILNSAFSGKLVN